MLDLGITPSFICPVANAKWGTPHHPVGHSGPRHTGDLCDYCHEPQFQIDDPWDERDGWTYTKTPFIITEREEIQPPREWLITPTLPAAA